MATLRERMVRDMELRGLAEDTQRSYLASVEGLARYYNEPPDQIDQERVRAYLEYLRAKAATLPSPKVLAKRVLADKVEIPSELFGNSEILMTNLSDAPKALGEPVTLSLKSHDTAAAMVRANSVNRRPISPCRNAIGTNTATSTTVVAITAKPTWRAPLRLQPDAFRHGPPCAGEYFRALRWNRRRPGRWRVPAQAG